MSKGNRFLSRQERRLPPSFSNLTNVSPTATPIYTRPHGGYRGVSDQYPLSVYGYDKPAEYVENVKNSVKTRYVDEENECSGSPQWVPRYNSEINHTGEQPLIVQQFLSGNKQEQRNGVLPAHIDIPPRLKSATHRYRGEERPDYQQGNSTHQYLTATETPGQSHQLFDKKLGRPTRTSLLRTRYRSHSAPGVRALLEVDHLHKQQYLAAKTEDKFKSVDIPKDLQPLTDSGETIHQFITGARYNRSVFRDANYLAAAGVSIRGQQSPRYYPNGREAENDYLTSSTDSFASTSIRSASQPSQSRKEAWGSDTSLSKSRPTRRIPSAAPTTTPLASRETFGPQSGAGQTTATSPLFRLQQQAQNPLTGSKTIIDGSNLHNSHPENGTGGCEDCIMCRKGVPFKAKGMPGTFSKKADQALKKTVGVSGRQKEKVEKYIQGVSKERKEFDSTGHQLVQQYHLRILGVKMGVEENRTPTAAPTGVSNKLHYNTAQSPRSRPTSSRRQFNTNKNNSGRRSSDDLSIHEVDQENRSRDDDERSVRSLSIRIDTPNLPSTPEESPRDEYSESERNRKSSDSDVNDNSSERITVQVDEQDDQVVSTTKQESVDNKDCNGETNGLLGEQTQDENGNHDTVIEHDATNKVEGNGDLQGDVDKQERVKHVNQSDLSQACHDAEIESKDDANTESGDDRPTEIKSKDDISDVSKVDMTAISDATENIEISGAVTDSADDVHTSAQPENVTDG